MATFTFPYRKDHHDNYYAEIPIRFERPSFTRNVNTTAIVDSGATISIFKAEFGDVLGLPVERVKAEQISGIGGSITASRHNVLASQQKSAIKNE